VLWRLLRHTVAFPRDRRFLPVTSDARRASRVTDAQLAYPIRRNQLTTPSESPAGTGIADPAPLGLAAFALTTFLLSASNAGLMKNGTGDAFLGYAFAYGGLGQLLAGMWEFRNRNVFGATAFSSYGGFWIGIGLYVLLVAVNQPAGSPTVGKDLAWILLSFAIFNTYMLIWSMQINGAVFAVFLTLEATEILLFVGGFAGNANISKIGGYVGILTALVAWYASAAGVVTGMAGRPVLPVGRPLVNFNRR
jgi:succinate-acetate transporter protein